MPIAALHRLMLVAILAGPGTSAVDLPEAGRDSFEYRIAIGRDELRGPAPAGTPAGIKAEIRPLLQGLRSAGNGLKATTEPNIESFFTVADAFEADGRLATACDVLTNLKEDLEALHAARAGKPQPKSLIASEDDLLHYRDAHNIHAITDHYLAGGQPSEKGYRWLKSKGVTTVVNLRQHSDHEKAMLERLGLRYVHIPWPDLQAPDPEQARLIVATVAAEARTGGKVFQHCLRGIGRDGTMVCCVRVAEGMDAEQAIREWLKVSPTWIDDQARDREGVPVQLKAVRQFQRELRRQGSPGKP